MWETLTRCSDWKKKKKNTRSCASVQHPYIWGPVRSLNIAQLFIIEDYQRWFSNLPWRQSFTSAEVNNAILQCKLACMYQHSGLRSYKFWVGCIVTTHKHLRFSFYEPFQRKGLFELLCFGWPQRREILVLTHYTTLRKILKRSLWVHIQANPLWWEKRLKRLRASSPAIKPVSVSTRRTHRYKDTHQQHPCKHPLWCQSKLVTNAAL